MMNWRTTLAGAIGAAAINIQNALSLINGEPINNWMAIITGAVIAVLGYLAKDAGMSGTTK